MEPSAAATAHERDKKMIEEALSSLRSWRARCSEVLQAAPRQGCDLSLRCLELLEKELSYTIACLTALNLRHVDMMDMQEWVEALTNIVSSSVLPDALNEADPQRQEQNTTLLRRAVQCFRRSRQHRHRPNHRLQFAVVTLYRDAESPHRYYPLITAIARNGFHEAADEGCPHNWSELLGYGDFPYWSYLLALYMAMFPCGHKFEKDRFIVKWLCEKARLDCSLGGSDPHTAQEEARTDRYFSDLVNRSVITHAAGNSRRIDADEAGAWQWNVNHLDHLFYASRSAEIGFVYTSATLINRLAAASSSATTDGSNKITRSQMKIARRLALHHDNPNIPSLLQDFDLSQTRSLAVSGAVSIGLVPLDQFVNLVVLDVEGWEDFKDEDLVRVCRSKMFFLTYLSIRNTTVTKLPPEIKELCSLQVLDASNTQVTEIPREIMEISLYRLDLRGTPKMTQPNQIMWLPKCLKTLLLGGEGIISSTETATRMPHDIHRFYFLRTLATVDLSEQPASFISALGELHYLRVLAITWSFHQSSDSDSCQALLSSIEELKDLESLTIHCGLGCSMEFLNSLSGPHWLLQKFKVTVGRFACVPRWFHGKSLSFLQITVCKLEDHDLELLRALPLLRCLILGLTFIPKEAIVIKYGWFNKLQRFSIECPVPWITFESEAMPKLIYLQLEFHAYPMSPVSVPMGINNLPSLAKVALWYNARYANSSSVRMTVEAVRKQVAKRHNTPQVIGLFINGIERDDVQAKDEETQSALGASSGTGAGAKDAVEPKRRPFQRQRLASA